MNSYVPAIVILTIVIIVLVIMLCMRKKENLKHLHKKCDMKKEKGCCTACSGCGAYTKKAEAVMIKEGRSRPIVVEGLVVDLRCYSQDKRNFKDEHITADGKTMKKCGTFCAKSGIPVGLLIGGAKATGKGRTYVLITPAPKLAKYMQKWLRISGRLMMDSKAIFVTGIMIRDDTTGKYITENIPRTPM